MHIKIFPVNPKCIPTIDAFHNHHVSSAYQIINAGKIYARKAPDENSFLF